MPLYSVRNTIDDSMQEVNMKYEEFMTYLEENKHIKQEFIKFPGTGDSIRLGIKKPSDSFRDVLREIKHNHHGRTSTINTF